MVSALETAQSSGDSTDFQTIIGNAVQQTLQANGSGGTSVTADTANTASSSDSTTSSDSTSSSGSTSTTNLDQLIKTLQQLFSNLGSSGNGQFLGLLVDTQN